MPANRSLAPVCLLAVLLAGCDESLGPYEPEPIVLAATYSETGRFARLAGEMALGYRMAVDMLNEGGGLAGREVRLVLVNDGSDAERSGDIYDEFARADTIDLLLGPYSSPLTEAAVVATDPAGIPLVAPLAASPGIWAGQGRQWSVQMLNPGPTYLQGSVELAAQHGARTAALVYENSQFPSSVATGVREAARVHGVEIVLDRTYEPGQANHHALLAAARDAEADLFIGGGYYDDAVGFAQAIPAVGYTPLLASLNLGPALAEFGERLGDRARCVPGNAPWLPTIRTTGFIADSETLVQRYRAANGTMPSYYVAAGFGAVELFAEAVEATTAGLEELDRAAIRDYLFSTTTETVLGPYGVYPPGDAQSGVQRVLKGLQVQWQDDGAGGLTRRIVHPPAVADAEVCLYRP